MRVTTDLFRSNISVVHNLNAFCENNDQVNEVNGKKSLPYGTHFPDRRSFWMKYPWCSSFYLVCRENGLYQALRRGTVPAFFFFTLVNSERQTGNFSPQPTSEFFFWRCGWTDGFLLVPTAYATLNYSLFFGPVEETSTRRFTHFDGFTHKSSFLAWSCQSHNWNTSTLHVFITTKLMPTHQLCPKSSWAAPTNKITEFRLDNNLVNGATDKTFAIWHQISRRGVVLDEVPTTCGSFTLSARD